MSGADSSNSKLILMVTSKWIGKYYVDSNGLYTPDKWVLTNRKYWYRHQDGSKKRMTLK